jgi:hypothetical protein
VPDTITLIIEAIGWAGALLILCAYMLLSTERIRSTSRTYHWMNVTGAAGFIVNSSWNGAVPSAVLNVIWLFIGFYALWKLRMRSSLPASSPPTSSTSATPSKRE